MFAIATPDVAYACRAGQQPLFHQALLDSIDGTVAVEAEVVADSGAFIDARVIKVLRGVDVAKVLRLPGESRGGCRSFPAVGDRGIIVGVLLSSLNGVSEISPIWAISADSINWELNVTERDLRKLVKDAWDKR
jgi:hypothetical protein